MILHDRNGEKRCMIIDPVKTLLMSTRHYRLYLASTTNQPDSASGLKDVLLRLASEQLENGIINAEAELLKKMQARSESIEEIVANQGDPPVHYDWLVPQLEATFIAEKSQDGRQANLLSFPDIAAAKLFPLPKLKDYCMIDCKTAAWILGRYLKLQSFLDVLGEQIAIDPNQFLMSPSKHRLIYLGFISAPFDARLPATSRSAKRNISVASRDVLDWTEPEQLHQEPEFSQLLKDFAERGRKDGATAHQDLYVWINRHWGVKYHPFTYFVKSEQVWKHDNTPIL